MKVKVSTTHGSSDRGLIAVQDLEPGEPILSVPFDKVFMSEREDDMDMHWAAGMALQLLRDIHVEKHEGSSNKRGLWISMLLRTGEVFTPLSFNETEVAALGDPFIIAEVQLMQICMRDCFQALMEEADNRFFTWAEFLWAVQVMTSRCFFEASLGGVHLAVPGVDMCNHSMNPNATVQIRHSTQYCQGRGALEEVCDVPSSSDDVNAGRNTDTGEGSFFELLAGPSGVSQGQEVTISYSSQAPSEFFLLLFGFVPEGGTANDSVTLFPTLQDMAQAWFQMFSPKDADCEATLNSKVSDVADIVGLPGNEQSVGRLNDQLPEAGTATLDSFLELVVNKYGLQPETFDRLVVTKEGIDARMSEAFHVVNEAMLLFQGSCLQEKAGRGPESNAGLRCNKFLLDVCKERLSLILGATAGATGAVHGTGQGVTEVASRLIVSFRQRKIAILEQVISQIENGR
ncbi:hypothetical protein CEUSTIGMA_g6876.t1 [Chlamydomonas eustigma]|uniref:SET domain-containing protein n=1 Tax=Chlamydomonas eustigma TaxID=1157962 RepID=A0A250X8N5_9CHLO|nr:hypothetical protein CEUSTIGMA_g6876.t1 [Chlamydomonas eustigma]|eukprot:GAX79435.1 hypothetical protein CEUSTIGMA_g6876.t1 [Chlamydomonas eustigma]